MKRRGKTTNSRHTFDGNPRHGAPPDRRTWTKPSRVAWALASTLILVAVIAFVKTNGGMIGPPTAPSAPSSLPYRPSVSPAISPATAPAMMPPPKELGNSAALESAFTSLTDSLDAIVGIAIEAVGGQQRPLTLGDWTSGPAWSTMKVPLVIAALREEDPPVVTHAMTAAITQSDNNAAESIWEGLGDTVTAAEKVEAVLQEAGDPTVVQSQKVRPGFTAFGQTDWKLADQVRFLAKSACDSRNDLVFDLMGEIEAGQRWGLAALPNSRYKGGWGPSPTGSYLVRQMGLAPTPGGMVAIAIAVQPTSGAFDDGVTAISSIGAWIQAHIGELPAGTCS